MTLSSTIFIISLLILGSTAAALGDYVEEICRAANRRAEGSECGDCLPGYAFASPYECVKACPTDLECGNLLREKCDGKRPDLGCGRCLGELIEVEGICVSENEVKNLVKRIEALLSEMEDGDRVQVLSPRQQEVAADDKLDDNNMADTPSDFRDRKSEAAITGERVDLGDPEVPADNGEPTTTESAADPTAGAADKRIPANLAQDNKDAKTIKVTDQHQATFSQLVFFIVVLVVSLLCVTSLIVAGVCWYRLYKRRKSMESSDYAGYGGDYKSKDGVTRSESGDRKLAHSAQMYHYQHHKQQMIALEKSKTDTAEDSDPEGELDGTEDGNYTVYECPGLAPAGEMEVSNPLFQASANPKSSLSPTSSNHSTDPGTE